MMKQGTLNNLAKRSAQRQLNPTSAKKAKAPAGTSSEPIDLDDNEIIDLDSSDEDEKNVKEDVKDLEIGTSAALPDPAPINTHDGPNTANPLRINEPTFDLASCFTHVEPKVIKKEPELDLLYFKTMIKGRQLFEYLLNELPWYRVTYQTRGITIRTPRWTCVWGCDDTGASQSVYKIRPRPIPSVLKQLKDFVEEQTQAKYNFVLVNYYENGKDSISWHSDDESFLGPLPCIASLSLGSPRDFQMKHKTDKSSPVEKWSLQSGDMVVMRGTTQSKWLHAVPKRANAGGRINITFRRAMNTAGTNNYYRYNVYTGPVHRWRENRMVATS